MSMMDQDKASPEVSSIPSVVVSTQNTDDDPPSKAMIALLPMTTDWCQIDLPHMTLVYAGDIEGRTVTDFNELAKDAASLALLCSRPVQVPVMGLAVFGPDDDRVNVLRLRLTPELAALRRTVEQWDDSEFPFNPHCTVGPVGSIVPFVPRALAFNRVYVGWGEQSITFNMSGVSY